MDKMFHVYISKAYFPIGSQPAKYKYTEIWDELDVPASSRTEAAQKAWQLKGEEWLQRMNSKVTTVRKVSLHVNDPISKTLATRLIPILVYKE